MSSIYVIPNKITTVNKPIEEWEESYDYFVIGRTSTFIFGVESILPYLSDDTPIVCIDNGTKITNLKELKDYYKKFNE